MKPQFITALYMGLNGTNFNGNPDSLYERYTSSLKSLAKGGYSIICYTSKREFPHLQTVFSDTPNLQFVVHELSDNEHHERINAIKSVNERYTQEASWNTRCVEIMWGKFYWLLANLPMLNLDDHLYWIDAGIFHGALISNNYRGENSTGFFDFYDITQKRNLFDDIKQYSEGKIVNIQSTMISHGSDDFEKVFGFRPEYGIIGGIFGGPKSELTEYINKMVSVMQKTLDAGVLLKEEELMFKVHNSAPDLYKVFTFDSWYHNEWPLDLFDPEKDIPFADFFKVIKND